MKKVKVGDKVIYKPWHGANRTAIVEEIEICKQEGEKSGRSVNSCDLDRHSNGVISLSDNHWCYFDQIKTIIKS